MASGGCRRPRRVGQVVLPSCDEAAASSPSLPSSERRERSNGHGSPFVDDNRRAGLAARRCLSCVFGDASKPVINGVAAEAYCGAMEDEAGALSGLRTVKTDLLIHGLAFIVITGSEKFGYVQAVMLLRACTSGRDSVCIYWSHACITLALTRLPGRDNVTHVVMNSSSVGSFNTLISISDIRKSSMLRARGVALRSSCVQPESIAEDTPRRAQAQIARLERGALNLVGLRGVDWALYARTSSAALVLCITEDVVHKQL
nr:hypothetical protein Iba_chr11bCG12500 [Ipomoea batatas]